MPDTKQQKEVTQVGFVLRGVTTEQFAVLKESFQQEEELVIASQLRFAKDNANRMIGVFSRFTFEQKDEMLLLIEVGCHFEIVVESWKHLCPVEEKDKVTLPSGFAQHLAIITVGTARGVLHVRTEQTTYNTLILPTIDVTELINGDVVIE